MFEQLAELARLIKELPPGTVLDETLRANLLNRILTIGKGTPQASTGESWDDFAASLRARYPSPDAVPPAGPPGPKPPPSPPVVPDEPPSFSSDLDDEAPDTQPPR